MDMQMMSVEEVKALLLRSKKRYLDAMKRSRGTEQFVKDLSYMSVFDIALRDLERKPKPKSHPLIRT